MKKYIFGLLAFALIFAACSEDSSGEVNYDGGTGDGSGGSLAVFALKGDYLYTVDNNSLNVFSLLDPAVPVKVNDIDVGFAIETLFAYGDNLYVGSRIGMFIYSIANPENPQKLSSAEHITACDPVVSDGHYSYVTLHSTAICGSEINALEVFDTSNPLNPVLLHTRNLIQPKGLGLYNNYLFVCDDEIKVFDVSNPAQPVLASFIDKSCFDVIILENELYAIGENGVYRYTLNPADINDITFRSQVLLNQ